MTSVTAASSMVLEKRAMPLGIDVSHYQPSVNWATVKKNGVEFAYIKATEGHSAYKYIILGSLINDANILAYISPTFSDQYTGATKAGLIRGGYHFAQPASSSGATQAKYFLAHGGKHSSIIVQSFLHKG